MLGSERLRGTSPVPQMSLLPTEPPIKINSWQRPYLAMPSVHTFVEITDGQLKGPGRWQGGVPGGSR